MPDAARIFLQVDSASNGGINSKAIINRFVDHGLLPASYKTAVEKQQPDLVNYKLIKNYFSTSNLVYLEFSKPQSGTVAVYDLQGRMMMQENFSHSEKINLYVPAIAQGMYLLNIHTENIQSTEKIIK
jgi:hypothetical protein